MKFILVVLASILMSSSVFAFSGQVFDLKEVSCLVEDVINKDTKLEEATSAVRIEPDLRDALKYGSDEKTLFKNEKYEVTLVISFLRYGPTLQLLVKSNDLVISAGGLRTSVESDQGAKDISCTFTKNTDNEE